MDERKRIRNAILVLTFFAITFTAAMLYMVYRSAPDAVRWPFYQSLAVASAGSALFIIGGAFLFYRVTDSVLRRVEEGDRRIKAIIGGAMDGFVTMDENGTIQAVNPAAETLFGYRRSELTGEHIGVLLASAHAHEEGHDLLKFLEVSALKRVGGVLEMRGLRKGGEIVPIELSINDVQSGETLAITVIIRDVTERRRAEETLQSAREDLEMRVRTRTADLEEANKRLQFEIEKRNRIESERQILLKRLQEALARIKTLGGLIPICASCKKVRDDKGYWNQIEEYVKRHSHAEFSHGVCPDCMKKLYPEFSPKRDSNTS